VVFSERATAAAAALSLSCFFICATLETGPLVVNAFETALPDATSFLCALLALLDVVTSVRCALFAKKTTGPFLKSAYRVIPGGCEEGSSWVLLFSLSLEGAAPFEELFPRSCVLLLQVLVLFFGKISPNGLGLRLAIRFEKFAFFALVLLSISAEDIVDRSCCCVETDEDVLICAKEDVLLFNVVAERPNGLAARLMMLPMLIVLLLFL
jgi:hypothetical protein